MRIEKFVSQDEPLSLTNDGKLELVWLGVGSAFAAANRQSNFLLIKGDDHVLVDFGMTGPAALQEATQLKPTDIRTILPTHSHADHVGGIECLALMNRYVGQRMFDHPKLKMVVNEEYQRVLWDYTLKGGLEWNEKGPNEGQKLQFCDFFDVIRPLWLREQPRETWTVDVGDMHVELFRTKHIPEQAGSWEASFITYGLFVDDRLFISGDSRFDQDLIDIYADLKTLPEKVKQKIWLYHYADNWEEQNIDGFAGWACPYPEHKYIFD